MDLSMEFLLKPVEVSHLFAKYEFELAYKLLTVLWMGPRRKTIMCLLAVFTMISLQGP